MKLFSFRNIRILILLAILSVAAIHTKQQYMYSTSWLNPLEVVIFPINADGSTQTATYIANLSSKAFSAIDQFTAKEAKKYGLYQNNPTKTILGPTINDMPPAPPAKNAFFLKVAMWSIKMRYWAWKNTPDGPSSHNRINMFVLYHDINNSQPLQRSLGMDKGLLGIVHAFASKQQDKQNNIVIAHELLHTVGATDKYDSVGNPVFPDGYAQPERNPLFPQYRAEIMAGRISQSRTSSTMALSLDSCVIGARTAREISWPDAQ